MTVPTGYSLIWNDEFNGTTLDTTKWFSDGAKCAPWFNEIAANVFLDGNGNVVFTSTKDASGNYYGGAITSRCDNTNTNIFTFKYGYLEIRAKLPDTNQINGIGMDLWLTSSTRWPPEIDITESGSGPVDSDYHSVNALNMTSHCNTSDASCVGTPSGNKDRTQEKTTFIHDAMGNPVNLSKDFHIYGLEWTPSYVSWLLDDVEQFRITTAIPQDNMYIIAGSSPGSWGSGPVQSNTPFPTNAYVDYVRVYQKGTSIPYQNDNFVQVGKSPDVGELQGVATDGSYFYIFGTNHIKKYDMNWNLITQNLNASIQCGRDHLGDGAYFNGKLYVGTKNIVDGCADWNSPAISIWNSSDLSFDSNIDISSQNFAASGVYVDTNNIYVISCCDPNHILVYDRVGGTFSAIILSKSLTGCNQGITKGKDGYFYIATSNGTNHINKVKVDGTVLYYMWNAGDSSNEIEGLDYTTDLLYYLRNENNYTNSYVYVLQKSALSASITINPAIITQGQSVTFTATVTGGTAPYTYAWTGLPVPCSGSIATISCTPSTTGTYNISVKVTDATGATATSPSSSLTVSPPSTLNQIQLSLSIKVGTTKQLTAKCFDNNNNTMTCPTLIWSSDNTSVATVGSTGVVKGIAKGTANIIASASGITANKFIITVTT